jgi:membrane-associated phospholipid phosphatase
MTTSGKGRVLIFFVVGFAVLLAVMAGLGWTVTHPLAHHWPITVEDGLDRRLVQDRTPTLNRVTGLISTVSSTPFAIALTALAALGARLVFHRWREAFFVAGAVAVEAGVFLLTTLLVDRGRPAVPHLDSAPPTSSFPSGHTAAALALYGAVAVLAWRRGAPWPIWVLLALPLAVGMSRLYRGMHHPSDVVAGLLLGLMALVLVHRMVLVRAPWRTEHRPTHAERARLFH